MLVKCYFAKSYTFSLLKIDKYNSFCKLFEQLIDIKTVVCSINTTNVLLNKFLIMKKLYYFLAAFVFISCSNDENIEASLDAAKDESQKVLNNLQLNCERRSYDEALEIAKKSITLLQSNATTRSNETRTLNLATGVKVMCQPTTRTAGAKNDTLVYVFNFNNDKGFAVVSAKRSTEELLAVVESGNYDPNEKLDNEVVEGYLKNALEYVANADEKIANTTESATTNNITRAFYCSWPKYTGQMVRGSKEEFVTDGPTYDIPEKCVIKWGQNDKMFKDAFGYSAGSGHIAAAQVMSVLEKPKKLKLQDGGDKTMLWSYINAFTKTSLTPSTSEQEIARDQILTLVKESRKRTGSKTSGATTIEKLRSYLQVESLSVGDIKNYPYNNWDTDIVSPLKNGQLIFACGTNEKKNTHFFIIDGCYCQNAHIRLLLQDYYNSDKWYVKEECARYANNWLNHINWGEGGKYNGLFYYNLFNADYSYNTNVRYFTVQ